MTDLHDLLIAGRMLGGSGTPAPEPTLITKSIAANGTYSAADDSADGYSAVTVNVDSVPVTFLKSIKSLGNSLIITDIVPAYNWKTIMSVKIGAKTSSGSSGGYIYGSITYDSSNNRIGMYALGLAVPAAPSYQWNVAYYLGNDWSASNYSMALNSRDTSNIVPATAKHGEYCTVGSTSKQINYTAALTDMTQPIGICGKSSNDQNGAIMPYDACEMTFYGIAIFDNSGVKLHDLVPAEHKTTHRGGMYDLMTGRFYPSHSDYDDFVKEAIT